MRLNLPRYNCIHFGISGEFTVSKDSDTEIQSFVNQTATHTHELTDERRRVALFGSRSRFGDINHRVLGSISRRQGSDEVHSVRLSITIDRAPDELPRPPSSFRPVSNVIDAASRLFGPIKISCDALFEYDQLHYLSRASFPSAMIVQDGSAGITHIEGAQFSRRVNGEVEHRISVTPSEDGTSFAHSIDFETTVALDRKSMHRLFNRARSISRQLLIPVEDGRNGTNST